jgi:FlaG/FlaF family flagellin (archaellin)
MQKSQNKNVGPIIGTFVVVIIIVIIALYVFASHIDRQARDQNDATSTTIIIDSKTAPDDIQTLKNDLNNAIK